MNVSQLNYHFNDIDIFWFNIPKSNKFFALPVSVLQKYGYFDKVGKMRSSITININPNVDNHCKKRNQEFHQYCFDYDCFDYERFSTLIE
jgi:hypothetical protein